MPQGNSHELPSGLWYQEPTTSSIPKLLFKSALRCGALFGAVFLVYEYRSMAWKYTYKEWIGKTMSFGRLTVLDHEPLSVEEIDKLKAKEKKKIYV